MHDLIDLSEVVRRVVAARVRDPHVIEDLTQETLVQVAAADPRLSADARQGYAIVTARNLVVSQARSKAVHDRHAHRLVDYTSLDGPEALTLEREETDALAAALQRLDADDRDLLLRHEADGISIDSLAAATGTSSGAIAMRLARARALLRVEFLLAFRRVELPTQRCRAILLALSSGDRRRQDTLGTAAHLVRCPACAQLARPVTERRRGIAAWLIVPAAEALRRAGRSLRRNHVTQAATVVGIAAVAVVAVVIAQPDGNERPAAAPETPVTSEAPATPVATAEPPTVASPPPPTLAAASVTDRATDATVGQAAECPAPLKLTRLGPDAMLGCPIAPTRLVVTAVPADEGFWAQPTKGPVLWIQLVGAGESPFDINPGTKLVVSGTIEHPAAAAGRIAADPRIIDAGYVLLATYNDIVVGAWTSPQR